MGELFVLGLVMSIPPWSLWLLRSTIIKQATILLKVKQQKKTGLYELT